MALRTVGTKAATQLACLNNWSQVLLPVDVGAIGATINPDNGFGIPVGVPAVVSPFYVLATGTTAGTTALTAVAARAGSPAVSTIRPGDLVLGSAANIVPGTCVAAVSGGGTTVTLSQAAASSGTGVALAFLRQDGVDGIGKEAMLWIPGRGMLKVLPGDIVAVDSTGWPILLSANTIAYAGSDWTLT